MIEDADTVNMEVDRMTQTRCDVREEIAEPLAEEKKKLRLIFLHIKHKKAFVKLDVRERGGYRWR